MKRRYQARCAMDCVDRHGRARLADRWVHIDGQTLWVCEVCAERLGREHGLTRRTVRGQQLLLAERELEAELEWTLDPEPETHSQPQAQGRP
jgi:hypothetical protein